MGMGRSDEISRALTSSSLMSMRADVRLLGIACGARAHVGGEMFGKSLSNVLFFELKTACGRIESFYVSYAPLNSVLHYQPGHQSHLRKRQPRQSATMLFPSSPERHAGNQKHISSRFPIMPCETVLVDRSQRLNPRRSSRSLIVLDDLPHRLLVRGTVLLEQVVRLSLCG